MRKSTMKAITTPKSKNTGSRTGSREIRSSRMSIGRVSREVMRSVVAMAVALTFERWLGYVR
jgi:hypothetical protein